VACIRPEAPALGIDNRNSLRAARTIAVVAGTALVACAALAFVAIGRSSPCDGISFHLRQRPQAATPPVGGQQAVPERLRRAFGLGSDVSYCHDFADPSVLRLGDRYYAYSTNSAGRNIPVLSGAGIFDTQHVADALPKLPRWSTPGRVWAPAILAIPGGFALYYATLERITGQECLSVAFASAPTGPFHDRSVAPIRCGAIDPHPLRDASGQTFLAWSEPGSILAARVAPDLRSIVDPVHTLIRADQRWEDGIVEAPAVIATGRTFELFFSGNRWNRASYAIGYATCTGPLGPCSQARGPWLASQGTIRGPGGEDLFRDGDGQEWMVFHAWIGVVGYPKGARNLFVLPVVVSNGRPAVVGRT
jgi:hypothetical protein